MASPHWKLAAPVLTLVLSSACVQAQPLRALVLSGANNHDWTQTTPALEQILEDSGRFEVDVTDDPSSMTADSLAAYDLVISNWTNWPEEERVWGEEAEKALLDFVRSGKGFSLFHAASACFSEWPEYQRLIGATWDKAATGHGAIHSFPVTITDHKHPITRGLPDFSIRDELWHKMAIQPKARALCAAESFAEKGGSGADEPVVLVSRFGNGRSFYLTLGHDVAAMDTLGWRMLMLRGAEWAATGRVTTDRPIPIEAALDRASDYTRHEDRGKLVGLDLLVQQAGHDAALREELAASLAAHLTSNATSDAKALFLGKLSVVGGPSDVSAMAALLTDEALDAAALFALERMPGKAATVALREAALDLSGASLAGAIAALGERGDAASAVLIAGHAAGDDPTVASPPSMPSAASAPRPPSRRSNMPCPPSMAMPRPRPSSGAPTGHAGTTRRKRPRPTPCSPAPLARRLSVRQHSPACSHAGGRGVGSCYSMRFAGTTQHCARGAFAPCGSSAVGS